MILDSGNRTEFETGAVRDIQEGKGRADLLPLDIVHRLLSWSGVNATPFEDDPLLNLDRFQQSGNAVWLIGAAVSFVKSGEFNGDMHTAMLEYSIHLEEGAKKYGDRNWQKGIPVENYVNSAVRHYLKHLRGDTDERHDRAFIWNCLCGAWTANHRPELNGYPLQEVS